MDMRKFSKRINNLEIRSCDTFLASFEKHDRAEIVLWYNEDNCYTIAYFKPSEEYFNLISVGPRICDKEIDYNNFIELVKYGFTKLDNIKF